MIGSIRLIGHPRLRGAAIRSRAVSTRQSGRSSSKWLALWISLPIVAALCVCGGIATALNKPDKPGKTNQPQALAAQASPTTTPSPSTVEPSPSNGTAAYLAALRAVGPDLIRGNEAHAIDAGRGLCDDIRGGLPQAQQAKRAATRYSGGGVTVTTQQGAQIVAAAVQHLCPDLTAAAAPPAPPPVTTKGTTKPPTKKPTTAPASVYYRNCDEVKAAGKAPLHRGDPGYRSGLDRDGDGIACEK